MKDREKEKEKVTEIEKKKIEREIEVVKMIKKEIKMNLWENRRIREEGKDIKRERESERDSEIKGDRRGWESRDRTKY